MPNPTRSNEIIIGCMLFLADAGAVAIGVSVGSDVLPKTSSDITGVGVSDGFGVWVGVLVDVGVTVFTNVEVGVLVGISVGVEVTVGKGTSIVISYESLGELLEADVYLLIRILYAPEPEYSVEVGLPARA